MLDMCSVEILKKTLEEMKTIYDFDDKHTYIREEDRRSDFDMKHPVLEIVTEDEETGIIITMDKVIEEIERPACKYRGEEV